MSKSIEDIRSEFGAVGVINQYSILDGSQMKISTPDAQIMRNQRIIDDKLTFIMGMLYATNTR